jgi:hypothetical protein
MIRRVGRIRLNVFAVTNHVFALICAATETQVGLNRANPPPDSGIQGMVQMHYIHG